MTYSHNSSCLFSYSFRAEFKNTYIQRSASCMYRYLSGVVHFQLVTAFSSVPVFLSHLFQNSTVILVPFVR